MPDSVHNTTTSQALSFAALLASATAGGAVFAVLFYNTIPGISVLLWAITYTAIVLLLQFQHYKSIPRDSIIIAASTLILGFFSLLRSSPLLLTLNILTILFLQLLLIKSNRNGALGNPWWNNHFYTVFELPIRMLISGIVVAFDNKHKTTLSIKNISNGIFATILGLIVGLPIVIIVILLLSSADNNFANLWKQILAYINIPTVLSYLFIGLSVAVVLWCVLSFQLLQTKSNEDVDRTPKAVLTTNIISISLSVIAWLLASVYVLFIIVQSRYLFGQTIALESDTTYSQLATRGFWEITFSLLISLVTVRASDFFVKFESPKLPLYIRIPLSIVALSFLPVAASALYRLTLYTQAYGLTQIRFYSYFWFTLLGIIGLALAIKIITGIKGAWYTQTGVITAVLLLIIANILNPDALIARSHLHTYRQNGFVDLYMISELSADAAPIQAEFLKESPSNFRIRTVQRQSDNTNNTVVTRSEYTYYECALAAQYNALKQANSNLLNFNMSRFTAERTLGTTKIQQVLESIPSDIKQYGKVFIRFKYCEEIGLRQQEVCPINNPQSICTQKQNE